MEAKENVARANSPFEAETLDIEQLRSLLFGADYQALLQLKAEWQDQGQYTLRVASIITEALAMRNQYDESIAMQLTPTIEQSIAQTIYANPKRLANALYPVMGSVIRQSINETLAQTLETFNQLLEQSLSMRALRWRFDAWRTGRSYSEVVLMQTLVYQVEQVFLIHRETSLLLHHVVSESAIVKDPDMVSSMLSAIQDFMADSFCEIGNEVLHSLRVGDLSIMIEQGPQAVLAAVIRGNPPAELKSLLKENLEQIHAHFSTALATYTGDGHTFMATEPQLLRCLKVKKAKKRHYKKQKPWLAYIALGLFSLGSIYWGYTHYQSETLWKETVKQWQQQAGFVITDIKAQQNGYLVTGLIDPLAVSPENTMSAEIKAAFNPQFALQPFLSLQPELILARVKSHLQAPDSVNLAFDQKTRTLLLSGSADEAWYQVAKQQVPLLAGIQHIDTQKLIVRPMPTAPNPFLARERHLQQLVTIIQQQRYRFELGQAEVDIQDPTIVLLAQQLRELFSLALQQGKMPQITLIGHVDEKGGEATNQKLLRDRANNMRMALLELGVPVNLLTTELTQTALLNAAMQKERSVSLQVELY